MSDSFRKYNFKLKDNDSGLAKNEIGLNQFLKPICFLVIAFILEIINYSVLGFKIPQTTATQIIPTYLFFDIAVWIFACGLMVICTKKWLANLFFYFFLFFQILMCVVNASLYKDFGYVFTWDMLELVFEAVDSFDSSFIDFKSIILYVSLFAICIAVPLIVDKYASKRKFALDKIARPIFFLISFFLCFVVAGATYTSQIAVLKTSDNDKYQAITSDRYLFDNMHIREEAYRKFGTWGFYLKNIYDLAFARFDDDEKESILSEVQLNNVAVNENATLYGDNLIVVMMESYEWFAIDPYLTPNLWQLKTGEGTSESIEGSAVVMSSYHANNKTNVSEDTVLLGYMPNINSFKVDGKKTLATAYSLPNLFSNLGYQTAYFHNWEKSFYSRNETNINMGFDKFYSIDDYQGENKSTKFNYFNLEADFTEQMLDNMISTENKFMSFYTTVSTHGSYEVYNERFEPYYQKYTEHKDEIVEWLTENGFNYPTDSHEQDILKQYKCAAMDTDVAVGKIFDHLKQNNLLDSTTVILYGDHNSYFHDLTYKIKGTDKNDYSVLKTQNVPLMIYSKKLTSETRDDFCNNYDLYPTICNLFGLGYNKLFCQGKNIFSDDIKNSVHVSVLTGYYSSTCYSKNMVDITLYEGATSADVETFKKNVCNFYEKQRKLEAIYRCGWKV